MRLNLKVLAVSALCGLTVMNVASAADGSSYANARFGYSVDVPPGFSEIAEAENSDGGTSRSADGEAELRIWGGYTTEGVFGQEIRWRIEQDESDGWRVSYHKQQADWASWSGARGDRVFYQRAVAACDGAVAYFRLEYGSDQMKLYDPVVSRLVKSLRRSGC